jgi:hypothetical protein
MTNALPIFLMLGLITYSLILLALSIGTWRRPAVGLGAVLCLYGLKQWGQSSTAFFSEYRQFTNYAVFVICVLGVIRASRMRSCVFCNTSTTALLVLAMYAYAFVSISWAPDPQMSLDQWITSAPYLVTITLLAPLLLTGVNDTRTAFIATALAGAAICALALAFGTWGDRGLVVFGHAALQDDSNIYRYETNPLALSTLAGTVFLICALSLGRPNGLVMRLLAMGCIPITLAVILRSGSRGQIIASGAGLVVALPIAFRPRDGKSFATLIFIAVLVLGLGWWAASLVDLNSSRWSNTQASQDVEGRLAMAQALLGASTSNFLTTIFGLGNSSAFKVVGFYPHITGLEVMAEEGIVGSAIYFSILFLAFRSVKRISGQFEMSESERNGLAILAGLFVFELILSWKQGSLLFSVYVFAYAIALARLEAPANARLWVRLPIATAATATTPSPPPFPNLLR